MIRKLLIVLAALAAAGWLAAGCRHKSIDTHLDSPYPFTRVAAIAPFMNQSPSPDVDPLAVSDLFFSELQMVHGLQVLPVNRSLQAMVALRMDTLRSPADALRLAEFMGADIIFVGAVTSYDPYDPPEVGLAVQLYARGGPGPEEAALVAATLGASARPLPVDPRSDPHLPRCQVNEVYNAAHKIVQKQVREYAEIRGAEDSPYGWRLYLKSARHYVRFCCYRAIGSILAAERYRVMISWTPLAQGRAGSADQPTGAPHE